jgi:hypothetical protein
MLSRKQFSAVLGITPFVFYFGTVLCEAGERYRSFDSGHLPELINRPACWTSEQPDPSRNCDFAQKSQI